MLIGFENLIVLPQKFANKLIDDTVVRVHDMVLVTMPGDMFIVSLVSHISLSLVCEYSRQILCLC